MTATPVDEATGGSRRNVRVMICDDSPVTRGAISRILRAEAGIEVAASVADGAAAIDAIHHHHRGTKIDVVLLDIEMPVMDGMEALPKMLSVDPALRVIVASSSATRGSAASIRALRLGAADCLSKPTVKGAQDETFRKELVSKIRALSGVNVPMTPDVLRRPEGSGPSAASSARPATGRLAAPRRRPTLLAVGSSTGGPQALQVFVRSLGRHFPLPVVVTQHMPPSFVPVLAEHLNSLGSLSCAVAADGTPLRPGHLLIAPGDQHLEIEQTGCGLVARLSDAPAENFCRPSVDVMLRSAAASCPGGVLVVMLTGMGRDGLAGTRDVVGGGGTALAQDEESSIVWGMPGAIATAGLASSILPPERLGETVIQMVTGR